MPIWKNVCFIIYRKWQKYNETEEKTEFYEENIIKQDKPK